MAGDLGLGQGTQRRVGIQLDVQHLGPSDDGEEMHVWLKGRRGRVWQCASGCGRVRLINLTPSVMCPGVFPPVISACKVSELAVHDLTDP